MSVSPFSAVFFEDRFVASPDARISLASPGYLLGEGVFASMRTYAGRCFRADRHLATLARGAEAFGMSLPMSLAQLTTIADEAGARTGAVSAYVRVTLARDADTSHAVLSVLARAMDVPSEADYEVGVPVVIVQARRIPPACVDPTVKMTSYAPSVLARRDALLRGAREGIQLTIDGSLACGTMANIFVLRGDVLLTPSLASGCRAGVTREAVIEIAAREGLDVREDRIEPAALMLADEVFFTSTRVECLPLMSVDGKALRSSTHRHRPHHPRTAALRTRLRNLIHEEVAARDRARAEG